MERRIYFYHLKKCAGTAVSSWISQRAQLENAFDGASMLPFSDHFHLGPDTYPELDKSLDAVASAVFETTDFVHTHVPLRKSAPQNALCFTIVREPTSRLISQVADWRRLTEEECNGMPFGYGDLVRDARRMRLNAFLENYATGCFLLDNYLVRALAAARLGFRVKEAKRPADLMAEALAALDLFPIVGLADQMSSTARLIEEHMGWPPMPPPLILNASTAENVSDEEVAECYPTLQTLTCFDSILYTAARKTFFSRDS